MTAMPSHTGSNHWRRAMRVAAPSAPSGTRLRRHAAGVSKKTGRAYPPFWSCPAPGCRTVIWDRGAMGAEGASASDAWPLRGEASP